MEYRFKDLRENEELKQYEIATIMGISRSNYSMIEIEKSNVKLFNLLKCCNYYNCTLDYMMNISQTNDSSRIISIDKIDKNIIRERLTIIEKEQNITAVKIARMLGIEKSTYSSYKSIKSNNIIQSLMLKKIALEYNYSVDWIIGRSNIKRR